MECLGIAVLLLAVIAVIAVALAFSALREARVAQRQIAALRAELAARPLAAVPELSAAAPVAAPEPTAAAPEPRAAAPEPAAPAVAVTGPAPAPPFAVPPPPPEISIEERLGTRAPVWIGSLALALAGAFLVKYSVDRGWIGPAVRFALAVAFGLALLGAGEALRRRAGRIASGLSAAGVAVLFAAWLAGANLFGLLAPPLAFLLLAATAALGVLLSLRQGIVVALVGLAGGYLTPALLDAPEPDGRGLFAFLLLLHLGVLAVASRRRWAGLPELALLGGLVWAGAWLGTGDVARDPLWPALFLAGVLASTLALARRHAQPHLAALAAAAAFLPLAAWGFDLSDAEAGRFLAAAAALGALAAGGSYLAHLGAARPDLWAALAGVSGLAFFVLAWASAQAERPGVPWAALALAAVPLHAAAALPAARRRAREGDGSPAAAALAHLAVAVAAWAALAAALGLERFAWTAAWALAVPALVALAARLRLPALRRAAALLALGVAVRLLANPWVLEYPIGPVPVWNPLLWGYGVPILALLAAAALARRAAAPGRSRLAAAFTALALLLLFALVTLEVRQAFHPAGLTEGATAPAEQYAYSLAWLLFGVGLLLLGIARRVRALRYASLAVMALAVVKVFLFDTAHLTDLYRVLSFLGLGVSLLLLAFLYQRFVFREPAG